MGGKARLVELRSPRTGRDRGELLWWRKVNWRGAIRVYKMEDKTSVKY